MSQSNLTVLRNDEPLPPISYGATPLTPMAMMGHALMNGASIETIKEIRALQKEIEESQARKAFDAALSAAKAEFPVITKNKLVDYASSDGKSRTSYRHEDLGEIARTIDPILGRHGLSYRFHATSEINQPIVVTCIVSHRDGHSEKNTLSGPRDDSGKKNQLQQMGSTITYLQRYTLKAALGLAAAADDDGASAGADDPSDTITDAQTDHLNQRIVAVKANVDLFLQHFRIESVPDLPAHRWDDAMRMLDAKEHQNKRGQS